MTLPASGTITMAQVNVELGRASSAADSLNDSWVRALAQKSGGAISFNDLHGKTGRFDGNLAQSFNTGQVVTNLSNPFFASTLINFFLNVSGPGNPSTTVACSGDPAFTGNVRLINNTTGISIVLPKAGSTYWSIASAPANLMRSGFTDSFTVIPST